MQKKSIRHKTIQVGALTLISRLFGLAREMLQVRYLGAGIISDAFFTAFKIPNALRKIFAEGALSAAIVPTIVTVMHQSSKEAVSRLMTVSFLFFQGILISLCLVCFYYADTVIRLVSPGWFLCAPAIGVSSGFFSKIFPALYECGQPALQAVYATHYLRILISFIIFLSSNALLTGALQAANHFFIPAFAPILLNIIFIGGIIAGLYYELPVEFLCYTILLGGLLQFVAHILVYCSLGFGFKLPNRQSWRTLGMVLIKFLPCFISMSIMEFNLFMSTTMASYLPQGSISLLYYANRFMGIPLGVFVTAFSTVLLPYFSKVGSYAPKRLNFYLYEAAKLMFWITVPMTILMCFLSKDIFVTLFLSNKFSLAQAIESQYILIAFLAALFFFAINRILLNIFYALHETRIPLLIAFLSSITNYGLAKLLLPWYGATGLALAFSIATGLVQTIALLATLHYWFSFTLYVYRFGYFMMNCIAQIAVVTISFMASYYGMMFLIKLCLPSSIALLLTQTVLFWGWAAPLCIGACWLMLATRHYFKIKLYFLDR